MPNPIDELIDKAFEHYDAKLKEAATLRNAGRLIEAAEAYENAAELALNNGDEWHCRRLHDACLNAATKFQEAFA